MLCPSCKQTLIVLEFDNVEVDYCIGCQGVWLDAGEYALILSGKPDTEGATLTCGGKAGHRPCPACGERMQVSELPGTEVEVDSCPRDHGVWFDRGELERALVAQTDSRRMVKLRQYCRKLFNASEDAEKPSWEL